jgi:hypothetical protein
MNDLARSLAVAALVAAAGRAQTVEIYSLFHRVDPFGRTVAADRAIAPREILSPAVPRNGFVSFHIAITLPAGDDYLLYVVPNPLNACKVALYKEHFVKTRDGFAPDTLTELHRLPDFGAVPDPDDRIEGQTTRLYLLDLWVPPGAPVARFRVEVQVKMGTWTVRPMEVRVTPLRVPELPAAADTPTALVDAPADATVLQAMGEYFAGATPAPPRELRTVRDVIRRNAAQDMALAPSLGPAELMRRALALFDANVRFVPRLLGAEWYLRIRDALYAGSVKVR